MFEFTAYFTNCKYIDKGVAMFAFPVTAQEIKNSVGMKPCSFEKVAHTISLKSTIISLHNFFHFSEFIY